MRETNPDKITKSDLEKPGFLAGLAAGTPFDDTEIHWFDDPVVVEKQQRGILGRGDRTVRVSIPRGVVFILRDYRPGITLVEWDGGAVQLEEDQDLPEPSEARIISRRGNPFISESELRSCRDEESDGRLQSFRRLNPYGSFARGGTPRADGKLTAAMRHALPSSDFAVPENEGLPIDTAGRTRAAMSRFNQYVFDSKAQAERAYKRITSRAKRLGIDDEHFQEEWRGFQMKSNPESAYQGGPLKIVATGQTREIWENRGVPPRLDWEVVARGFRTLPEAEEYIARHFPEADVLPRSNPLEPSAIGGVAKALWIPAWADYQRDTGGEDPGPGGNWVDIAPEPPAEVMDMARDYVAKIEMASGKTMVALLMDAARADGVHGDAFDDEYAEEFGYYVTMQGLGYGPVWEERHEPIEINVPMAEANYDGDELWVSM